MTTGDVLVLKLPVSAGAFSKVGYKRFPFLILNTGLKELHSMNCRWLLNWHSLYCLQVLESPRHVLKLEGV